MPGRLMSALVAAALVAASCLPSHAQRRIPLVRDAEIEALVRDYARPIFKAAGLSKAGVEIILVNDQSFNAFVAGRRMFINTGALLQAETPNEIIGVIAHEAGHLAGGHQERLRDQIARAQTMAIVGSLLGLGAIAAGAATDSRELAGAGGGIMMGGGEAARRSLLGYQRSEETTADRSAITYLQATGQSAKGMLKTFERFQSALALSGTKIDPYRVSHPAPRDRIANLQALATASNYYDVVDPPALQQRHDMMRAKIAVYTQGQAGAARLLRKGGDGLAAQYGDAMATHLYGNLQSAVKKADALVKAQPKNPYFHELNGDVLMKANKPAQAAEAYRNAVRLDPAKSGLLRIALGQALIATGDPASLNKALTELEAGLERDRENPTGYRYLAQAYGQLGNIPEAELATAEGYYYSGAFQDAKVMAARAQSKMKRGSPGWVRAQDIINFKTPKSNKN
ncbi:M48 family metallopeptidase [Pseudaminobacter sp. 19-2017]|uniref:M48 family metallopeptidase n=2 Tax=Pseudaminobacter soli (ex Zhang et al. 2022) TaxID=2831468 RepID=A0A942E754_9HYPH|nr:M48 family metalloprotease [Pseudaminobacter soli]MBS3652166.1 M48 family metallopeptidase [Pseudaminobacter soli]